MWKLGAFILIMALMVLLVNCERIERKDHARSLVENAGSVFDLELSELNLSLEDYQSKSTFIADRYYLEYALSPLVRDLLEICADSEYVQMLSKNNYPSSANKLKEKMNEVADVDGYVCAGDRYSPTSGNTYFSVVIGTNKLLLYVSIN